MILHRSFRSFQTDILQFQLPHNPAPKTNMIHARCRHFARARVACQGLRIWLYRSRYKSHECMRARMCVPINAKCTKNFPRQEFV